MKQLLLILAVVALVGCSPAVEIANPIVEKAIREKLKKPKGELTEADLEKVTELELKQNQLTDVPKGLEKLTKLRSFYLSHNQLTNVKGLENLTQLEYIDLRFNLFLTPAQIDELRKALPKCDIRPKPTN